MYMEVSCASPSDTSAAGLFAQSQEGLVLPEKRWDQQFPLTEDYLEDLATDADQG